MARPYSNDRPILPSQYVVDTYSLPTLTVDSELLPANIIQMHVIDHTAPNFQEMINHRSRTHETIRPGCECTVKNACFVIFAGFLSSLTAFVWTGLACKLDHRDNEFTLKAITYMSIIGASGGMVAGFLNSCLVARIVRSTDNDTSSALTDAPDDLTMSPNDSAITPNNPTTSIIELTVSQNNPTISPNELTIRPDNTSP